MYLYLLRSQVPRSPEIGKRLRAVRLCAQGGGIAQTNPSRVTCTDIRTSAQDHTGAVAVGTSARVGYDHIKVLGAGR